MAIKQGPATSGEKELKTDYPVEEGLEAATQKQTGRIMNLIPEKSTVQQVEWTGIK